MQAFTTTKAGISRKSPLIQRLIFFSKCEKILFKMRLRFIVFLGRMENDFAKMINYWGSTAKLVIWHTSLSDTNRKRVFFLHEQSINDQLWVIRQLFADVFNELVNNVAGAPRQHQRSACFECDVCVESNLTFTGRSKRQNFALEIEACNWCRKRFAMLNIFVSLGAATLMAIN